MRRKTRFFSKINYFSHGDDSKRGFTLVELLIVIVIIAILAVLIIISYNGLQQRANNTQRITAAKEWQKLIQNYVSTKGRYPLSSGPGTHVCLGWGNPTSWAGNTDSSEDCFVSNNIKNANTNVNNDFATISTLPKFPAKELARSANTTALGISLRTVDTLDPLGVPKTDYPMLIYWLEGNDQDCVLRPLVKSVSGGYEIDNNISYSLNEGPSTRCIVAMPDPNNI